MNNINDDIFNTLKERMKAKFPILLAGFLKDAKAYIIAIQTNIPDGDLNHVIESAHSLKSASGLLGLTIVHKHAETLEYKGKNLLEDGAQAPYALELHVNDLHNAFLEVEGYIQNELSKA